MRQQAALLVVMTISFVATPVLADPEQSYANLTNRFLLEESTESEFFHKEKMVESINQCYDRVRQGCRARYDNTQAQQYYECVDRGYKYCEQNNR